jgi:hypothetical protein
VLWPCRVLVCWWVSVCVSECRPLIGVYQHVCGGGHVGVVVGVGKSCVSVGVSGRRRCLCVAGVGVAIGCVSACAAVCVGVCRRVWQALVWVGVVYAGSSLCDSMFVMTPSCFRCAVVAYVPSRCGLCRVRVLSFVLFGVVCRSVFVGVCRCVVSVSASVVLFMLSCGVPFEGRYVRLVRFLGFRCGARAASSVNFLSSLSSSVSVRGFALFRVVGRFGVCYVACAAARRASFASIVARVVW